MMGKMSRDKGARGERELASRLRAAGYSEACRGRQYHGGADSPDVIGLPGIHIECKRMEKLSLYTAIAQAKADCGNKLPAVFHRRNDCEWLVIMELDDWLEIYREWEAGRTTKEERKDG